MRSPTNPRRPTCPPRLSVFRPCSFCSLRYLPEAKLPGVSLGPSLHRRDRMRMNEVERHAAPGEVMIETFQHGRRPVPVSACAQFVRRQPHGPHDARVQRHSRHLSRRRAAERKPQIRDRPARPLEVREIRADKRLRLEMVRGFLERLALHGVDECFSRFQMAGGLINLEPIRRVLLDHEKAPVQFHNCRVRHASCPSFWFHGTSFYRFTRFYVARGVSARSCPMGSFFANVSVTVTIIRKLQLNTRLITCTGVSAYKT